MFGLPSDLPRVAWKNLRQKPTLDRIFYVPFWDCPHNCAFCCVDSLPGKPPRDPDAGEAPLLTMLDALHARTGKPLQVHLYGGEPLMRPEAVLRLAERLMDRPSFKKLYVYSTLRPDKGARELVELLGADRLRIVVNDFTADDRVRATMAELDGVAEFYKNVVVFPTGRGDEQGPAYRRSALERIMPAWAPGRSCFANASGMMINGAHGTMHLCCLPQSPVFGTFDEAPDLLLARYEATLDSFHREVLAAMRAHGLSHACSACQLTASWDTRTPPSTDHLTDLGPEAVHLSPLP